MSIYNLHLRGEIRNLICGDSSSLELWIDPLIWSYDSQHVQIDQRNGSRVNTLRQLKAPDKVSFFLVKKYCYPRLTEIDCWETRCTFWTNMKLRLVSALYKKKISEIRFFYCERNQQQQ